MKHLIKYNESISDDDLFDQIKDIIVDIKDEYPDLKGDIFTYKDDNPALCQIILDCENVKIAGEYGSIENYLDKWKFINLILDTSKRLEEAFNVKIYIPHLDNFTHWQYHSVKITLLKK